VPGDAAIEIGGTYSYEGWPESQRGRKARVLARVADGLYSIRWPDGQEAVLSAAHLAGPVEPARPGIDERCLRCGGSKKVELSSPDPQRPWIVRVEGTTPCPNCTPR
jgi:hypothetical protein